MPPSLELRHHAERREHQHLDQPAGCVEQAGGQHDVPDRNAVDLRQERHRFAGQFPQGVDQVGDDLLARAEGPQHHVAHRRPVGGRFRTDHDIGGWAHVRRP